VSYGTLDSSDVAFDGFPAIVVYFDGEKHNSGSHVYQGDKVYYKVFPPHVANKEFLGKHCFIQFYVEHTYGLSLTPALSLLIPQRQEVKTYCYCFSEDAPIHLFNGKTIEVKNVCVGDRLITPDGEETTVMAVKTTAHYCERNMVDMGDYLITVGHPILVQGDWYRPDELFPVVRRYVTRVYNFYCEPHHFLIVGIENPTTVSSLGGYCPRIAQLDPYTDYIYGSGYGTALARRYEWLLSLKERIPNERVEEETEKYWAGRQAMAQRESEEMELHGKDCSVVCY